MRKLIESGVEWLGPTPESWSIVQLGSLFSEHKKKNIGMQSKNLLSLSYGRIIRKDINTSDGLLPESFEGYNIIDDRDIVLRLTDLQNDHRSLRVGLCHETGIVTSAYVTLRPRSLSLNSNYFYYLIHSYDVKKGFYGMGAGVRQGLNYAGVKKIMLTLPSEREQAIIAEFLTDKIKNIDTLIANVQKQISMLKEYRSSVIKESVTKGLDSSVQMRDSGIYNIGFIPQHWTVRRIKTMATIANGKEIEAEGGDIPVYGSGGVFKYTNKPLHSGTSMLYGRKGTIDRPRLVDGDFWTVDTMFYTSEIRDVNPKFLYYTSSVLIDFAFYKSGSVLPSMTQTELGRAYITYPPIEEQVQIVSYLDGKCAYVDRLIAVKESKIEKLEQYKKSLIYEYVTGKKEVS